MLVVYALTLIKQKAASLRVFAKLTFSKDVDPIIVNGIQRSEALLR